MRRDLEWLDYKREDGSLAFNRAHGTEHFLVIGASGSGKTTVINNLMASVVVKGAGTKAMVYDSKQELLPLLYSLHEARDDLPRFTGEGETVKILNPFDARCCSWNMAMDIDSVVSARQIATILIPESDVGSKADSFFTNSSRDILTALMVSFMETMPNKQAWTFRDVILAALYEPYLEFVLSRSTQSGTRTPIPMLDRVWHTYFGPTVDPRTRANIQASLSSKLSIFEPIAAAWHRATTPRDTQTECEPSPHRVFSLKDWAQTEGEEVLVLGNDEASRAALDAINQAIFKRATELILARPDQPKEQKDTGHNQAWFFLDEVREAGYLDGLGRLLTKGRSKGACVVLGFQDIDGLRDVYGEEVANEICAQCNNIAIMRINSPSTAQWASDSFGRRVTGAENRGLSLQTGGESGGGLSLSRGTSEEERPFLYTEAFLYLPTARDAKAVVGYCKGPGTSIGGLTNPQAISDLRFRVEKEQATPHTNAAYRGKYIPSSSGQYLLAPWTQEDFVRLGLDGPPPHWKTLVKIREASREEAAELSNLLKGFMDRVKKQ